MENCWCVPLYMAPVVKWAALYMARFPNNYLVHFAVRCLNMPFVEAVPTDRRNTGLLLSTLYMCSLEGWMINHPLPGAVERSPPPYLPFDGSTAPFYYFCISGRLLLFIPPHNDHRHE